MGPSSTTIFSIDDNNTVISRGMNKNSSGSRSGFRQLSSEGVLSSMNYQNCGNQDKKDCGHLRCRTCVKLEGFIVLLA